MQYEIYGTNECVSCTQAKELLTEHNKPYTFINVNESEDIRTAFFKRFPGKIKTVPQIVIQVVLRQELLLRQLKVVNLQMLLEKL